MVNATGSLWRAVPDFGAMAAPDAAMIARVYVLGTAVLWALAAIVLLTNGPRDLARRPRQVGD
jgi:hypothetical protein